MFHLKLKKSVLHISLGCIWAVLGSCFLYLYSPDFSYRIIILFGLYLLFRAKLDHILVCFSLYSLISYLTECYGVYFYSLLTGTNVLDNPLILSLCRIFVSLFFLLLCIPFYRSTVTILSISRLSVKNNLFISGLCFLHLGLIGILNTFFNYDMSTVGRRLMVILTLILLLMFSTIFYLYLKLKKSKEKLEESSRLQQYQWELEKQHYLDLQKKDQALRKFRHDYKHHILAMQELAARKDYGELLTYLNDLSHIQSQTASLSTNNPVADAILNYFDSIKPAHTEFCVDGRFQPHCFVSETHLCILLSNLLKNALETASGLLKDFYPVQMEDSPAILCRDILYIQSDHKYSTFHCRDGVKHLCRRSLKSLLEELSPYGFCAISRSTVVNLKYCEKIKDGKLFLTTEESLSISRRYSHQLVQNYQIFIAGNQSTSTSAP